MTHPFDLSISDLEMVELLGEKQLADSSSAQIKGGILPGDRMTTQALGEEGGIGCPPCGGYFPPPCNGPRYLGPPVATTMALGEEGGCFPEPTC